MNSIIEPRGVSLALLQGYLTIVSREFLSLFEVYSCTGCVFVKIQYLLPWKCRIFRECPWQLQLTFAFLNARVCDFKIILSYNINLNLRQNYTRKVRTDYLKNKKKNLFLYHLLLLSS